MTVWRWFRDGKLLVETEQMPSGTIIVKDALGTDSTGVVLSACVSPAGQKPKIDKQIARLPDFAGKKKPSVIQSVTEVRSAMNSHRPKLKNSRDYPSAPAADSRSNSRNLIARVINLAINIQNLPVRFFFTITKLSGRRHV